MRKTWGGWLLAAAVLVPCAGNAQVAWDSPMLMPPAGPPGFGLYLIDAHGGNLGVLGTWRSPAWNFGVRGGLAEQAGPRDRIAIFAGIDFDGGLTRATSDFPLDIDWVLGAGVSVGSDILISAPVGLSIGHSFTGQGTTFTPYVTPRVVLDAFLGDDRSDNVRLDLAFDLGLDLRFTRDFMVRFGATLGDREAVAIGVVF